MSIQYTLANAYLSKLYEQGLITFEEMEQLEKEMLRLHGSSADGRKTA